MVTILDLPIISKFQTEHPFSLFTHKLSAAFLISESLYEIDEWSIKASEKKSLRAVIFSYYELRHPSCTFGNTQKAQLQRE